MQPVSTMISTPTLAALLTAMSHLHHPPSQLTVDSPDQQGVYIHYALAKYQ